MKNEIAKIRVFCVLSNHLEFRKLSSESMFLLPNWLNAWISDDISGFWMNLKINKALLHFFFSPSTFGGCEFSNFFGWAICWFKNYSELFSEKNKIAEPMKMTDLKLSFRFSSRICSLSFSSNRIQNSGMARKIRCNNE